jgi:hypothetical protein
MHYAVPFCNIAKLLASACCAISVQRSGDHCTLGVRTQAAEHRHYRRFIHPKAVLGISGEFKNMTSMPLASSCTASCCSAITRDTDVKLTASTKAVRDRQIAVAVHIEAAARLVCSTRSKCQLALLRALERDQCLTVYYMAPAATWSSVEHQTVM